jgi:Tfp pilus assembly protein PilE
MRSFFSILYTLPVFAYTTYQNLKKKTAQMKAMAAELNMYQAQVSYYILDMSYV